MTPIDPKLAAAAAAAKGFLPADEALALYEAALLGAAVGPLLEIGTYCGKSALYLAAAARRFGRKVITVDHHRGSEEQQPGWEYHDPSLVDPELGVIDTVPTMRRTLHAAGVEDDVVAIIGRSPAVAALWATPLGFLFIDGGHTDEHAQTDYAGWTPHLAPDGILAIHDIFPDPVDGGQAPYRIWLRAIESELYDELPSTGSLRVLRRRT